MTTEFVHLTRCLLLELGASAYALAVLGVVWYPRACVY